MEILNIERWDSLVEFRRDLRDTHYYQQVVVVFVECGCRVVILNSFNLIFVLNFKTD